VGQVLAHALRARTRRIGLGLVPGGSGRTGGHHEQGGQTSANLKRQRGRDTAVVAAVDQGAGTAREPEKGVEGGQLTAAVQQLLDAGVDDVGQVVAGARGLDAGSHGDTTRLAVVAGNSDVAAHEGREPDTVAGGVVAGDLGNGIGQSSCRSNVVDDCARHGGDAHDVAEALEALEQDQQRQARPGPARPLPRRRARLPRA
jgi:hypothetical protein